ncbi:MAG: cytochrome c [Candidatus Eremiobacteraeota bacterium]|nr:cytochrome c [Candidatus Eremiobacteraeota bacterium]
MRFPAFAFSSFLLAAILVLVAVGSRQPSEAQSSGDVAHGQYLVNDTGQCADCHGGGLKGAPLPFKITVPAPPGVTFADAAPNIAGLTMFRTDEDAVKFFMTGLLPSGQRARPPMPQYRFNDGDARAIVAYLRSLKT